MELCVEHKNNERKEVRWGEAAPALYRVSSTESEPRRRGDERRAGEAEPSSTVVWSKASFFVFFG